jgi:hypothetical protein
MDIVDTEWNPVWQRFSPGQVAAIRYQIRVGFDICRNVSKQRHAVMTHEERTALRTILHGIGTRVSHRTEDREICRLLSQRFRRLARDIDWLEALKDSTSSRFAYQTLLNALYVLAVSLAVLVSTAMLQSGGPEGTTMVLRPNVTTSGDPPPSATCILELHRAGEAFLGPFRQQRYFVRGDVQRDWVASLSDDPAVVERVRRRLFANKTVPGPDEAPVATLILGGSGAGKGFVLGNMRHHHGRMYDRMQGSVYLNTDEVMELLPGYDSLINIDHIAGIPVTDVNVANLYHDPAETIADVMMQECLNEGYSFVFDGTGNNMQKIERRIRGYKHRGYDVQVLVVIADSMTRLERTRTRAVLDGRYVPPEVVVKGHSEEVWYNLLESLHRAGVVDHYLIHNNTP